MKTYIAYSKKLDLHKIGRSKNPEQRILSLKNNHKDIELKYIININVEQSFHVHFSEKLIKVGLEKEWFKLDEDDLAWLEGVSNLDNHQLILLQAQFSKYIGIYETVAKEKRIVRMNKKIEKYSRLLAELKTK
jgi:hypothetical protein